MTATKTSLKMWSRAASNFIILIPSLSVCKMLAVALCTIDITNFGSVLWLRHWTWYLLRVLSGESHVHQQIYVIFEDFYRQKKQNPYVVVNFLSQVIFVFLLFWGMVTCAKTRLDMEKRVQMSDFIHKCSVITVGKMYMIQHFTKNCMDSRMS